MKTMKAHYSLKALTALALASLIPLTTRAQLVADGQTNILVGVTNILPNGLVVGSNGSFTFLGLTAGSVVGSSFLTVSTFSAVGGALGANSNTVLVTGANSSWTNGWLNIGFGGSSYNQLIVSNGGTVRNELVYFGSSGASNNAILVTGAGSQFITRQGFTNFGNGNQLTVNNGGFVSNVNSDFRGTNNLITISDPGSLMRSALLLGGVSSALLVTNGGVYSGSLVLNGSNNFALFDGGSMFMTNNNVSSIQITRGTLILNSGLIDANRVRIINSGPAGAMQFNGGTLRTRGLTNNNGSAFVVGNGTSPASLFLEGTNGHSFGDGLTVRSNATAFLNGGVVTSPAGLTIQSGGRVQAGSNDVLAAGTLVFLVGGTFSLEGYTQGPALGFLAQTAESDIDFGALGTAQILTFSSITNHALGRTLHISHWEGTPGTGGGTDELLITATNSVTTAFLADVQFDGYAPGALLLGTGELVPLGVPEPTTFALAALGLVALLAQMRRSGINGN